jgi:hypothetical protein
MIDTMRDFFPALSRVLVISGMVVLPLSSTPTQAQCVAADVSLQVAVHGSRQPAQQTNDVGFSQSGACRGNWSLNNSRQIQVGGTGEVVQERQSHTHFQGDPNDSRPGESTVFVPVGVGVDVYNPAEQLRSRRTSR